MPGSAGADAAGASADRSLPPRLVVLSSLFPSGARPGAGLFVRERMFRVAPTLPLLVVSPQPWFPFQGLIRRLRPHYRPMPAARELQQGVEVFFPRFFALPVLGRWLDGLSMGVSTWWLLRKLRRRYALQVIDSHFAYPDGYAATWAGRRLGLPVTITLRGTEVPLSRLPLRSRLMRSALRQATRVFAVSDSLRRVAVEFGVDARRTRVLANGVDIERFHPVERQSAREALGLPADARVLVSVGALVERKGFHRVIELLPALRERYPTLRYLVVGGGSPEGDLSAQLREQVRQLGLEEVVHFLGPVAPEQLRVPLSAADVFVLATANEGWANVFLEAMACGLPVVTTRVGGNAEVVCRPELGTLVPFGDSPALAGALEEALQRQWDRTAILQHARDNTWDHCVSALVEEFTAMGCSPAAVEPAHRAGEGAHAAAAPTLALVGPMPPPAGGMANQTRQLARLLEAAGVQVEVVPTNAPYRPAWVAEFPSVRAAFRLVFYLAALWRAFGRAQVCHLMANSGWSWHLFAAPAVWLAWLRGVPILVNYRGGQAPEFLARSVRAVRATLRLADALVVPSGFLREVFASHGLATRVVPNVVDLQRFRPTARPADGQRFDILVARNLESIYGIDTAIRALALLRRELPQAVLTLAGTGEQEPALRALVAELGEVEAVRFVGQVDGEQMPTLYAEATVALNPSLVDNMPNSVLEALAAGVPIVSTEVGGVPFIVTHEQTALLVPAADPQAMAAALLRLAREPGLAAGLAARGLQEVRQYDWSQVRVQLLELYARLAERRPRRPQAAPRGQSVQG